MENSRPAPMDAAPPSAGSPSSPSVSPASQPQPRREHRSTAMRPSDRELLHQGRRAFERGDDAAALRCLERLVESGLRFADVHYMLGIVHERLGALEAATASLREAIRINPAYVEALLALASVCERQGDYAQSERHAERAGQLCRASAGGLDPTTRGKLANQQAALADALAQAGLRREAIEQYRQALDRCPTFLDVRYRLGVTLREAGLPFQALQEFERILDAHPGLVASRIQAGLTYYGMGRAGEAVREWQRALDLDPTRREARMYLRLVGPTAEGGAAPTLPPSPAATTARAAPVSGWSTVPLAADSEPAAARADRPSGVHPE
jgi:tetratricopeptide (TPR) repeat protein